MERKARMLAIYYPSTWEIYASISYAWGHWKIYMIYLAIVNISYWAYAFKFVVIISHYDDWISTPLCCVVEMVIMSMFCCAMNGFINRISSLGHGGGGCVRVVVQIGYVMGVVVVVVVFVVFVYVSMSVWHYLYYYIYYCINPSSFFHDVIVHIILINAYFY